MCDKNTALSLLQNVDERVRAELGDAVIKTYLYGSYARGDYNTESGVDIAVIVTLELYSLISLDKFLGRLSSNLSLCYDVTVSIVSISNIYFEKFSEVQPFYSNILREGIVYENR